MLIGRQGGCDAVSLIAFQVVLRLLLPRSILTSEHGESRSSRFNLLGGQQSAIDRWPTRGTEFGAGSSPVSERL